MGSAIKGLQSIKMNYSGITQIVVNIASHVAITKMIQVGNLISTTQGGQPFKIIVTARKNTYSFEKSQEIMAFTYMHLHS